VAALVALWVGRGREVPTGVTRSSGRQEQGPPPPASASREIAAATGRAPLPETPAVAPESAAPSPGLPAELEQALLRYREASDAGTRAEALLELALSDDPGILEVLVEELRGARPAERRALVEALIQHGRREAVPHLRRLAEQSGSADEARLLAEAADYLSLPSLTEVRRGQGMEGAGVLPAP
jgi:hypothetical protein